MKSEIPVVFAANNEFVPYLGVAITSLISNSHEDNTYSVFILHVNISSVNQERLENLSTRNIFIQCKDV